MPSAPPAMKLRSSPYLLSGIHPNESPITCWLAGFDLTEVMGTPVDLMIGLRFPAYLIPHPNKVLWILHQFRTAYELWDHQLGDLIYSPKELRFAMLFVRLIATLLTGPAGLCEFGERSRPAQVLFATSSPRRFITHRQMQTSSVRARPKTICFSQPALFT